MSKIYRINIDENKYLASDQPRRCRTLATVPLSAEVAHPSGSCQPVTVGIPYPKGALREPEALRLLGPEGRSVPLQALPLARWSDGSVKWLLVDFLLDARVAGSSRWTLVEDEDQDQDHDPRSRSLIVREDPQSIVVETGAATFHVGKGGQPLIR